MCELCGFLWDYFYSQYSDGSRWQDQAHREFQCAAPCRVVPIGTNETIWTSVREDHEVKSRSLAFIQLLLAVSLNPDLAFP